MDSQEKLKLTELYSSSNFDHLAFIMQHVNANNAASDLILKKYFIIIQEFFKATPFELSKVKVIITFENNKLQWSLLDYALLNNKSYVEELIKLTDTNLLIEELEVYSKLDKKFDEYVHFSKLLLAIVRYADAEKLQLIIINNEQVRINILEFFLVNNLHSNLAELTEKDRDLSKPGIPTSEDFKTNAAKLGQNIIEILAKSCKFSIINKLLSLDYIMADVILSSFSNKVLAAIFTKELPNLKIVENPNPGQLDILNRFIAAAFAETTADKTISFKQDMLLCMNDENLRRFLKMWPGVSDAIVAGKTRYNDEGDITLLNRIVSIMLEDEKPFSLTNFLLYQLSLVNKQKYLMRHPELEFVESLSGIQPEDFREFQRTVAKLVFLPGFLSTHLNTNLVAIVLAYYEAQFMFDSASKPTITAEVESKPEPKVGFFDKRNFKSDLANKINELIKKASVPSSKVKKDNPVIIFEEESKQPQTCVQQIRALRTKPNYEEVRDVVKDIVELQEKNLRISIKAWEKKIVKDNNSPQLKLTTQKFGVEARVLPKLPTSRNSFLQAIVDQILIQNLPIRGATREILLLRIIDELRASHKNFDVNQIEITNELMLATVAKVLAVNIALVRSDIPEPIIIKGDDPIATLYLGYDAVSKCFQSLSVINGMTNNLQSYFESGTNSFRP